MKAVTISLGEKLKAKQKDWKDGAPERARLREERRVEAAAARASAEEARLEGLAEMPRFVVREVREVTVAAETMNDAIKIASIAFEKGQDDDGSLEWHHRPFNTEGDTVDLIRTTNIKATEED